MNMHAGEERRGEERREGTERLPERRTRGTPAKPRLLTLPQCQGHTLSPVPCLDFISPSRRFDMYTKAIAIRTPYEYIHACVCSSNVGVPSGGNNN